MTSQAMALAGGREVSRQPGSSPGITIWEVRELVPEYGAAQIRCGGWCADPAGGDPDPLVDTLRGVMRRYGVWG